MPGKRELTWQPGTGGRQGRWKKKYRGRTLYLGSAGSKSDLEAYRLAMDVWRTRKAGIDAEEAARPKPHQADYEAAIREWEQVLRWSLEHGDDRTAGAARLKLSDLRDRLNRKVPAALAREDRFWSSFEWPRELLSSISASLAGAGIAADATDNRKSASIVNPAEHHVERLDGTPARIQRKIWQDRLHTRSAPEATRDQSVAAHMARYLHDEQRRVEAGELSAGRFTSKQSNLHDFRDWLGHSTALKAITGDRLLEYRRHLLARIREHQLARDTAHGRMNDIKAFIRSLWETEVLEELPRLLAQGSKKLTIGRQVTTPEFFTAEEVKQSLNAANERTRLYLLLMLNCGMYQGDIANLHPDEVDWNSGTITRKRSKTRGHESVPTVRYQLWHQTLQLLRKFRTTAGDRVLVNRNGNPLVVRSLKPDGRAQTNDSIRNAYNRLRDKTGIRKPLKLLRKTSANLIRSNEQYRGLEDLFLGHSPGSMSDRHYTVPPQELLARAITWLGPQYDIT